jgi:hypothetical protein
MDYLDRAPFEFNGKIEKIHISYLVINDNYFCRPTTTKTAGLPV